MYLLMETLTRTLNAIMMAAPNTDKTVRMLQYLLEGFPIPATCNEFVLSKARTNHDGEVPFHQVIVVSQFRLPLQLDVDLTRRTGCQLRVHLDVVINIEATTTQDIQLWPSSRSEPN